MPSLLRSPLLCLPPLAALSALWSHPPQEKPVYPDLPAGAPPPIANDAARAERPEEMQRYVERIPGSAASFVMVPIPGGTFLLGSPAQETGRKEDEGPQRRVAIEPFWMGEREVTWDEYHVFMLKLDQDLRRSDPSAAAPQDEWADAVSRPTPPYVPMDFDMGVAGFPAVCMTHFAARHYTKWLSQKTGRFYRLPSEAEWEYACRAGTGTAFSFGDDPAQLGEYAWSFDNAGERYQPVGRKKPNPWGLHDMHGNVAEWVLDRYEAGFYATLSAEGAGPGAVAWPSAPYPHVVRGGSWDDDPPRLRSAARRASTPSWKVKDPQMPKSIWYLTSAPFVGFRLARPLREPSEEERRRAWEPECDEIRRILERQRTGAR